MTKQLKHPQERTVKISLNQQQLDQIIHGLTLLNTAPMNTVDPHYDSTNVFFVSTKDTLGLFTDLNNSTDPSDFDFNSLHGFCL